MLKYSMQVRIGMMDGIFLAYHNTKRLFGFQYIPLYVPALFSTALALTAAPRWTRDYLGRLRWVMQLSNTASPCLRLCSRRCFRCSQTRQVL